MGHIGAALVMVAVFVIATIVLCPDAGALGSVALHASGFTFAVAAMIDEPPY